MQEPVRFIKIAEVSKRTSAPAPTIYWWISKGRFPKPVKTGVRAAAWIEAEVDAWIAERIKLARKVV